MRHGLKGQLCGRIEDALHGRLLSRSTNRNDETMGMKENGAKVRFKDGTIPRMD